MEENKTPVNLPSTDELPTPPADTASAGISPVVKGTRRTMKIAVAAAVLIIAAIAAFALPGLTATPKKKVSNAFNATVDAIQAQTETLQNEVPAFAMQQTEAVSQRTDFDFRFLFLNGTFDSDVTAIANLLSGLGIQGSYALDPEHSTTEFNAELALQGNGIAGLYAYLSPDLLAVQLPDFSDTALSLNPQTLAEDIRNHPELSRMDLSDEEIQAFSDLITSYTDMLAQAGRLDTGEMKAEIDTILGSMLVNASYEKGSRENGLQSYTVTIPGADVKKALIAVMRYLYVDSPITGIYDWMFPPELYEDTAQGASFSQLIEEQIIQPLETDMPELDTVITLQTDRLIRRAHIVITPADSRSVEPIILDYILDEDLSKEITVSTVIDGNELIFYLADSYRDGAYSLSFDCTLCVQEVTANLFTLEMALDKEGLYEMSMDLDLSDLGEPTAMGLDLSGTVFCQEETVSRSFPTIEISFESYGERFQIGFSVESTVSPLTAPCTFDHTATSLFSLSTDELQEEFLKYKSGAKSALMKAMMMMYQANPGLFTA